ncbi:MAG: DUF1653 domain-containing protein [Planctomycetia bacterium]
MPSSPGGNSGCSTRRATRYRSPPLRKPQGRSHCETLEELVVYRQEYGDRGLWVRPAAMFAETVVINGKSVPRFQRIDGKGAG